MNLVRYSVKYRVKAMVRAKRKSKDRIRKLRHIRKETGQRGAHCRVSRESNKRRSENVSDEKQRVSIN